MKIEALIKAFESGDPKKLPEEFAFLVDPDFKAEIEALGSKKEKIKAAAQVLADETGNIDKETVGKLAGAMKQAGLLEGEGDNEETSEDDAPKEGEEGSEEVPQEDGEIPDEASEEGEEVPSEEAGQGDTEGNYSDSEGSPVEDEEEQTVDEEGNPIEEGSSEELEPAAVDEDGNPIEGDSAESDSPVADHLQRFKDNAGAPATSGAAGEGGKLQRVVQRALAAIGALLVSD